MKRLVAGLFCLLLLWAQGSAAMLPLATATGVHPGCASCDCGQISCCQQPPASQQPFPSATSPGFSVSQLWLSAAWFQYELPSAAARQDAGGVFLLAPPSSVPLFQQHCSLLI